MSEIEALEQLHRAAQARLGLAVALFTRDRWSSVQATDPSKGARDWTRRVAEAVLAARELSYELARSYYQVARAIETGFTMGEPLDARTATLGNLRDLFLTRALAVADLGNDTAATAFHALFTSDIGDGALEEVDISPFVQRLLDEMDEGTDSRTIRVDSFNWDFTRQDMVNSSQIVSQLNDRAVKPLTDEIKRGMRRDGTLKKNLRSINAAHAGAGGVGAGAADKLALTPGRQAIEKAGERDVRVIKFARGLGPNPCYFCAALASRGFVFKTQGSAGSAWHENCHCFPIARWTKDSPLPALNQFFVDNWQQVTRNDSGKGKLTAWRNWLARTRRQEGGLPT